jgi:hypothetical protein
MLSKPARRTRRHLRSATEWELFVVTTWVGPPRLQHHQMLGLRATYGGERYATVERCEASAVSQSKR